MLTKCLFPICKNHISALWKTVEPFKLLSASEKFAIPNVEIVRFRARRDARAAKEAARKAKKLANAIKPAPIPEFLLRKVKASAELERRRCVDENWLEMQPVDNVWSMKMYRGKPYPVSEALEILRGYNHPTMYNDPNALLYVTTELELKLKRKGRFMAEFNGIITFPHEFEAHKKNKIAVVCKESEDQLKASEAGASYTGSTALIKQIFSGVLTTEDFDYLICHPDMYKELNALRVILKKKYPNVQNGLLRLDIERAVSSFIRAIDYNMKRSVLEVDFGWVDICCGRLSMPDNQIEDNIKHALGVIEQHKPFGTGDRLFILRTLLWCEKVREQLKIPHWEYLPNYPENGVMTEADGNEEVASSK